jgi:hypothetical protein
MKPIKKKSCSKFTKIRKAMLGLKKKDGITQILKGHGKTIPALIILVAIGMLVAALSGMIMVGGFSF